MTTVLSKLILLGIAPVLLMDNAGFLGREFWVLTTAEVEDALATSISIEELPMGAWVVKGFDSLFEAALSPVELSVLEAILAALGWWDKSLEAELEIASVSLLSGMTWGLFNILPSMGLPP